MRHSLGGVRAARKPAVESMDERQAQLTQRVMSVESWKSNGDASSLRWAGNCSVRSSVSVKYGRDAREAPLDTGCNPSPRHNSLWIHRWNGHSAITVAIDPTMGGCPRSPSGESRFCRYFQSSICPRIPRGIGIQYRHCGRIQCE